MYALSRRPILSQFPRPQILDSASPSPMFTRDALPLMASRKSGSCHSAECSSGIATTKYSPGGRLNEYSPDFDARVLRTRQGFSPELPRHHGRWGRPAPSQRCRGHRALPDPRTPDQRSVNVIATCVASCIRLTGTSATSRPSMVAHLNIHPAGEFGTRT